MCRSLFSIRESPQCKPTRFQLLAIIIGTKCIGFYVHVSTHVDISVKLINCHGVLWREGERERNHIDLTLSIGVSMNL